MGPDAGPALASGPDAGPEPSVGPGPGRCQVLRAAFARIAARRCTASPSLVAS